LVSFILIPTQIYSTFLHPSGVRRMMQGVKDMFESKLDKCGGPGCVRRVQKDGSDLSQCGRYVTLFYVHLVFILSYRCKSAVYCGLPHQKAAWATHKPTCFAPTF
jgi:hypothetical protein